MMNPISLFSRWLVNIIEIQEKKQYNFYVILIFAVFVGLTRYFLEFMLSHRTILVTNISIISFITFYLECIFLYTLVLKLCVPGLVWQRSIHLVLIGVFLGIFPPIIDVFISGIGVTQYYYTRSWNFFIYDGKFVPFGEALVLWLTIFFTGLVVFIKTKNFIRTLFSIVLSYAAIYFYGSFLTIISYKLKDYFEIPLKTPGFEVESFYERMFFSGYQYPEILSVLQVFIVALVYFILNRHIVKKIVKKVNHSFPVVLTCLLGFSVVTELNVYAFVSAGLVFYLTLVMIIQNDYFDVKEDVYAGKTTYLSVDDVRFFNTTIWLILLILLISGYWFAYGLVLCFIVSYIYNYDFYRGKSYFPAMYKIEGVWGFSALFTGMATAMALKYSLMGDPVNIQKIGIFSEGSAYVQSINLAKEIWTIEMLFFVFFVFGGWSMISVIKDYKDIESDYHVGNQTVYALLKKKNYDIERFHKIYTRTLAVLLFIPFLWLWKIEAPNVFYIVMALSIFAFYRVINWPPSTKAVESALGAINFYLLFFVLACHFSHVNL